MPNAQLMPRALVVRRTGLGALSFDEWSKDPNFSAIWGKIQAQIQSEGGDLTLAKNAYLEGVNQLSQIPSGLTDSQVFQAAGKYTLAARSVASIVQNVAGLVQAAEQGAPPIQLASQFTGVLIGAAVAAGALSAGVGAAIVGTVSVVSAIVESQMKQAPAVKGPCGLTFTETPPCTVGCLGSNTCSAALRSDPTSPNFRPFPEPDQDPAWFLTYDWQNKNKGYSAWGSVIGALSNWRGSGWWLPEQPPWGAQRAIDLVTLTGSEGPNDLIVNGHVTPSPYAALMATIDYEIKTGIPQSNLPNDEKALAIQFVKGFLTAWKAARAYAFNGLRPVDDWQTLLHYTKRWNRVHAPGRGYAMAPDTPNYFGKLIRDISNNAYSELLTGKLFANTGSRATAAFVPGSLVAQPGGTSTAAKVATGTLVVGGAAAAGVGIWAWATHQAYGAAWKKIWDETGGRAVRGTKKLLTKR